MAITELRILPPFAIGRLGASPTPLEAYELRVDPAAPLDYRRLVPCETFEVNPATGEIARCYQPKNIRFRDGEQIRPVAPFLEVYARTGEDELEPLTLGLLAAEGLNAEHVRWTVKVGNIKAHRRTGKKEDRIYAQVERVNDHAEHPLLGECDNFLPGKKLPLGRIRYICPTPKFPGIRLRFTPAAGRVYGANKRRKTAKDQCEDDPVLCHDDQFIYKPEGAWVGHFDLGSPTDTMPNNIYAGYADGNNWVSWGYLDDECDGVVTVELSDKDGNPWLSAHGRIAAGPPAFAPDSLPIRTVQDELEQVLEGPLATGAVSPEVAIEVVRRALDTVRLMNTAVMNGNTMAGRTNIASTMARQDTNDYGLPYKPIMAQSLVDQWAVRALHERILGTLLGGAAPWFSEVLRRPEEIGDFTDQGRRKMPALMRGADGRMLALTRRHISQIVQAALAASTAGQAPPSHP